MDQIKRNLLKVGAGVILLATAYYFINYWKNNQKNN